MTVPTLTAAGSSWRWQLRDSKGQWVEMGSEVKWLAQGVLHQGKVTGSPSPGVATVRDADGNDRNVPSSRLTALTPAPATPAAVPDTAGRRLTRQVREKTQKASLTFKQTPTMEAAMQDMADIIQTDVDPKNQEAAIEATSDVIVGEIAGNLPKRLQLLDRVKELRQRGADAHVRLAVYIHTQPKLKKLTEKAKIWAEEFLGDSYASENPAPGWSAIPTMIGLPNPASHPAEFLVESSRMITQLLKAASALVGSGRPVIAAGDSWRWQLRDKDGKWIEMGSEVKWLARGRWKFGIVVGSPAPGVATVEEALTAIRHDLPSARLEVVEQGAALIELVDSIRDEKGRVDWKTLNLSRDAATAVIQKAADQKIELQDRREKYARQMGARVKEWLASDTPPWTDSEGIRAGKYPGITVIDRTWTAKGQSPGAGQYDSETGNFVITELGLSGDERNDDWRKSLILHEAGHALQMRIFDDIGWRDTHKNALFDAIRRPEPVTYKDRNGANNRSRLESPFEEEGHAPGHHDEDKEVVADAISVILSGTSYQHEGNPKAVALLNAVAEQMDQHGWEHPPLYEKPPLPEWTNWRKGTTFDGPEWVQRPGGDEISIRKAKAGYFIVAIDHHGAGPMSRTGTAKTLAEAKAKGAELLAGLQADREPKKVAKPPDKIAAGDLKPGSVYTTRLDRDRVRVLDIIPEDNSDYVSFNGVILDGPNAGGGTIMSMKRTLQLNDEGHSDGQDFDRDVLAPAKVLLEGLKTKYPDGLAAALQEALTPEEEPRPEMSDRLKELGRTTEIVRWQADLGLAQARLRELEDERATAPPGRSMALQIKMDAARDEVESLTAWRVGGVIEEYDRLLKEHQEAGREWIQRSIVGGGSITPHSPKAQRILADVREVGRMIRVGVDIEVLERGTPAPNPERTKLEQELNRLRDQRNPLYEERSRGIEVLPGMTDDDKDAAILALDQQINADLQPINRAILDVQVLLNKIPDDDSVDPAFRGLTYSTDQKRLFTKWARRRELARRAVAELVGTTTETKQTWAPPKVPVPDDGTIYGRNLGDLTPEQQAAMTTMLLAYPASWVERFDQQIVTTSMGTRGWNNGPHIVISNKDGQGLSNGHNSMWATIIHEQGHGMESQVPGLAGLQAVWWHDRLGVKSKKDLFSDDGAFFPHRSGLEHPDNLARPTAQDYTLKAYGNVYSSAIPHWEVFTTGVQEVLGDGKDSYTTQHGPAGYDADLWEFTMGTLLTLDGRKA